MANRRDVNLVIRAQDEASRGIEKISSKLAGLGLDQGEAATTAARLAKELTGLERLSSRFAQSSEQMAASVSSQAQKLLSTNAAITERKNRIEELTRALKLLQAESGKEFVGPSRFGAPDAIAGQISAIKKEIRAAETQLNGGRGLTAQFDKDIAKLREMREAQRVYADAAKQADGAVATLTGEIAQQTAAMDANAAASKRAQAAQQFFNNRFAPGLSRAGTTSDEQAEIAAVLRAAEARDIKIQKYREEARAIAVVEKEQRALNALLDKSTGKSAEASASVFATSEPTQAMRAAEALEQEALAAKQADGAVAQLRNESVQLAAIQSRLATATARLADMEKRGAITAKEHAAALKLLKAEAAQAQNALGGGALDSRGRPSLFGLKPYELQNLSFQINDIFTQLASGTSLQQTLAQQSGQLFQLFPRLGNVIAGAFKSPPIIAFAAALGTVALAVSEVNSRAQRLREFGALLTLSADGAAHNAKKMTEATVALEHYALSAEDAAKVVRAFTAAGFDDSQIQRFGRSAKDLADILGIEVADAAKQLAEGFNGSFEAVDKLDKGLNFLTATQRDQIKQLFEQGRAADALRVAQDALTGKLDEAARQARGPWTEAFRSLTGAWNDFKSALADSSWSTNLANQFNSLGRGITQLIRRMRGLREVVDVDNEITDVQNRIATRKSGPVRNALITLGNGTTLEQDEAQLNTLLKEREQIVARTNAANAEGGKITAEEENRIGKANARLREQTEQIDGRNKKLSDAERLANAYNKAMIEAGNLFPDSSPEERARFAAAKRLEVEKQITEEHKRQAAEAKREAEERRRANIEALNDNRNDQLVATAQRFNGFTEAANQEQLETFLKKSGIDISPLKAGAELMNWCAAFVNAVLAENGLPGTGKLNAKSFLSFGTDASRDPQVGDIVILNRGNNPAEGHVGFFQGFDENGNVKVLGGNQREGVNTKSFNKDNVVGIRRAPSASQVARDEFRGLEESVKKQNELNTAVEESNRLRGVNTAELEKQRGLQDTALIEQQIKSAGEKAVAELQRRVEQSNANLKPYERKLELTREQIEATRQAAEEEARAQQAAALTQARLNEVKRPVDSLTARRDELRERIEFLRGEGEDNLAAKLVPQLDEVNARLVTALTALQAFYQGLTDVQKVDLKLTADDIAAIGLAIDSAKQRSREWGTVMGISAQQIAQAFSSSMVNAIDRFAQKIAEGEDAFKSARDAFLQFAADFLRMIAQMILQQIAFNIAKSVLSSFGVKVGTNHSGGIAGRDRTSTRTVSPMWFAGAMRYHSGGIAGLRPNEVPAILERGEEVLTRGDPRHRANLGAQQGGSGGNPGNVSVVNVFDPADVLDKALGTKAGERVFLNFVQNNPGAFKAALG